MTEPSGAPVGRGDRVVQQGECLLSIAREAGHHWETIWNDPANADLKRIRQDPGAILPGDRLTVPPSRPRQEDGATEQEHRFRSRASRALLRLRLVDDQGEPLRDRKYRLTVGASVREGRIPQDGLVEQEVPADAREGTLTLWLRGDPEGPGFDVKLDIGALDPHDTVSGLQARLYNMGLYDGAIDGQDSEELQAAVRKFRESTGGPEERDLNSQVKDRYGR